MFSKIIVSNEGISVKAYIQEKVKSNNGDDVNIYNVYITAASLKLLMDIEIHSSDVDFYLYY